jgi:geranylgeranyl transferase type-2 subunit beta
MARSQVTVGEIDTRFTYCALSTLPFSCTGSRRGCVERLSIYSARNLDGGFAVGCGAESHAGPSVCCGGALSIAQSLDLLEQDGTDLLGWWLRNGRWIQVVWKTRKADVCLFLVDFVGIWYHGKLSWINGDRLASLYEYQDDEDGGIADRPDDMADVFTRFGIAGL